MKRFVDESTWEGEKIKGSRFIVTLCPIQDPSDVKNILSKLEKVHTNANHHCWAYRWGEDERSSDDGEPSGSAGEPILQRMKRAELTDSLVVVTRYFGGTKLGVGGLVRAYGGAAGDAIAASNTVELLERHRMEIGCAYTDQATIKSVLRTVNGVIDLEEYTDIVRYEVLVEPAYAQELQVQVFERTAGRIEVLFKRVQMIVV